MKLLLLFGVLEKYVQVSEKKHVKLKNRCVSGNSIWNFYGKFHALESRRRVAVQLLLEIASEITKRHFPAGRLIIAKSNW